MPFPFVVGEMAKLPSRQFVGDQREGCIGPCTGFRQLADLSGDLSRTIATITGRNGYRGNQADCRSVGDNQAIRDPSQPFGVVRTK
ncbi:Uncharacterised protein [Mycobacterium tuberculosis]|nr:Uncharacterised protein [Mycobacterium tuberculosis]